MICAQIALESKYTLYHQRSGYEFEWDCQPVQMALAAYLGQYASNIIGSNELKDICSAILLHTLDAFVKISDDQLAGKLKEATDRIRDSLNTHLRDTDAVLNVDNLIKEYRAQIKHKR